MKKRHSTTHLIHKQRVTVSLSREATSFLKAFRAEARVPSLSALLERIIAEFRRAQEMRKLSTQVTAYYDGLSEDERQDQAAWGEVVEVDLGRSENPQ